MIIMSYEKFTVATFILLGITSIIFSLAIIYFVNITALSVEALIPPGEDVTALNATFGVGYLFGVLEFALGITALISAYTMLKKKK
jgi:hypothetical protein